MSTEAPEIRRASPADFPAIAHMLAQNFRRGKFALALGMDPAIRRRRLELLLPYGVICQGQVYVIIAEGATAATFTIRTAENAPSAGSFHRARAALRESDGWLRAWWATTLLRLLSGPRLGPQDAYLDNLVTAQAFQRRGIVSRSAGFFYQECLALGKTCLWADIMSNNRRVIGLFQKEGWEIVGRNYWLAPMTWPLFGTPGILRIRKVLHPLADR